MILSLSTIFKSECSISTRIHYRSVLNPITLFSYLNTKLEDMKSSLGILNVCIHNFPFSSELNRKNIYADLNKEDLNLLKALDMSAKCKILL